MSAQGEADADSAHPDVRQHISPISYPIDAHSLYSNSEA